jgi:hypothetical protein
MAQLGLEPTQSIAKLSGLRRCPVVFMQVLTRVVQLVLGAMNMLLARLNEAGQRAPPIVVVRVEGLEGQGSMSEKRSVERTSNRRSSSRRCRMSATISSR